VAAALDILMAIGMDEEAAAKELLAMLEHLGIELKQNRPEKLKWRTITLT
jgi:hypothetical protein